MKSDDARLLMDQIRRIVHALRSSHRTAGNLSLTGAQLFVINVIGNADHPLSVNDVAQRTKTDQSTVSVVTTRLVNRRLLKRQRSTKDTRRVELSLTPQGRALYKKAPTTVAQQNLATAIESLSASDAKTLVRLLDRITKEMGIGEDPVRMLFEEPSTSPKRR
jgi:DNA-binding MarR family transcriptional regulator